ncbi:MAG: hypothetical protein Q8909_13265 [Bacteroidota bacterium]|nr:hypothetical protein [Bacteroidota bacterium]
MTSKRKPVTGNPDEMSVAERVKAPTPKFFKSLRTIGIVLATVGGTILAAPVALPAALVTVAGYAALAGGVMSAVSQTAVDNKAANTTEDGNR